MNDKLKMRFEELKNVCKLSDAAAQEVICAENEIEWQVEILKSVDEAISLSGKQLSSLGDLLAKTSDPEVERTLTNAISKALALQEDLTKEQIAYMAAKTAAMARGDAMITIDGAGLQPHLEAFMFEILSAIQIRANAEGQNFLLGL